MSAFASIPLQLGRILLVTTSLRQLDLRSTASATTDSVLRVICCYLTQLTHLNLKGCHQLTAFGFLGPTKEERKLADDEFIDFVDTGQDISNLKKMVNLNISGLKIKDQVFEYLKVTIIIWKSVTQNRLFDALDPIAYASIIIHALQKLIFRCPIAFRIKEIRL